MPKMLEFVDHILPLLFHPVSRQQVHHQRPLPWQHVKSLMKVAGTFDKPFKFSNSTFTDCSKPPLMYHSKCTVGAVQALNTALSFIPLPSCLQNIWIRYSAVGFVCGIAQEMGGIDTACFLTPRLEAYLRQPVMDLSNQYLLLSTLKNPLLRPIYDYVLKQNYLESFFNWCACTTCVCVCVCVCACVCVGNSSVPVCSLIERRSTRELCRPGYEVKYPPMSERFEPVSVNPTTLCICSD